MSDKASLYETLRERSGRDHHPTVLTRFNPPWVVEDESFAALAELITGRTIVKVTRESDCGDLPQYANKVVITLDDGAMLVFNGWGYDSSGLETAYMPAEGSI